MPPWRHPCLARAAAVAVPASMMASVTSYRARSHDATGPVHAAEAPPFPVRDGFEIRLVQVLARHGARTPFATLPGMPEPESPEWTALWGQCRRPCVAASRTASAGGGAGGGAALSAEVGGPAITTDGSLHQYVPCGRGQLTRLGEEQLVRVGSFLRQQYLEGKGSMPLLTPGKPSREELKVVSTKTSRTIFSACSMLRGMFPDVPEAWLEALVEVPREVAEEILLANHTRCARLRQLFHEEKMKVDAALLSTSTRLRLRKEVGPASDKLTLIAAGDPLRAYRGHGFQIPDSISTGVADDLDACGHELVDVVSGRHSHELRRLSSGLLLADTHGEIMAAVAERSPLRCAVRSGHDVSVCALVAALGLPIHHWPGFASSVIVELLRDRSSGAFHVRIALHDGVPIASGAAVDVTVPLEAWKGVVAPLILSEEDYVRECRLPPGVPIPLPHKW